MNKNKEELIDIKKLTDKDILNSLIELQDTHYWKIIKEYNRRRYGFCLNYLETVDAYKRPSDVPKTQGNIMGLFDMEKYVESVVKNRKEKMLEKNKKQKK